MQEDFEKLPETQKRDHRGLFFAYLDFSAWRSKVGSHAPSCVASASAGDLLHDISLKNIADLYVVEFLEPDAALKSGSDLARVVLETLER